MVLILVGIIKENSNIDGFRFIDLATLKRKDIDYVTLLKGMLDKTIITDNLKVVDNEIVVKSGSLSRYGVTSLKYEDRIDKITIIGNIEDNYLLASNVEGELILYSKKELAEFYNEDLFTRICFSNINVNGDNIIFLDGYKPLSQEEIFNTSKTIRDIHKSMIKFNILGIDKIKYSIYDSKIDFIDREYKFNKVCVPNIEGYNIKASFPYDREIESIIISEGIRHIKDKAFMMCSRMHSVYLPETLEKIDNEAFAYCVSLENIRIPKSVKRIGYNCFRGCKKIKDLYIPKHLMQDQEKDRIYYGIPERVKVIVY